LTFTETENCMPKFRPTRSNSRHEENASAIDGNEIV
jgi:hypothetical protein